MMKKSNDILSINTQISNLARDIVDADVNLKPCISLKLKDILSSQSIEESQQTLKEIWRCKLPHTIVECLKQDFSLVSGSWLTACQLISIGVECCHVDPKILMELKRDFIPALVYASLNICTNIIKDHSSASPLFKGNLCGNISWLISALTSLLKKYVFVTVLVVSSKNFLQFLMTEDGKLSFMALSFLQSIIETNCDVFYHVAESRMRNISDELAFKISSTEDVKVARKASSILLNLLRMYQSLLDLFITKRYRGFKKYLEKWRNNGFDDDIDNVCKMLETKTEQIKASHKFINAATVIQSSYRGHLTRQRLKSVAEAISTFQKIYRTKKKTEGENKETEKMLQTKKEVVELRRRRDFVESKEKHLKSIESIPAKTVEKFLHNVQEGSARKIQATWTGWKTRHQMKCILPQMKREKAAVIIQHQVRNWLSLLKSRREEARLDMLPNGLTDTRRIELQNVLVNIREKFPKSDVEQSQLENLHQQAHHMLSNHVIGLRSMRRKDDHRRALIGQLSIQSEIYSHMPSLDAVTQKTIDEFSSRSTPVMMASRERHTKMIKEYNKQWWELL